MNPLVQMFPALAGTIGGAIQGERANSAQEQAARRIESLYGGINAPTIEEQQLILEMLSSQGQLTPEMLQALSLGPSAMEQVQADQNAINQQTQALNTLGEISQTGLTDADRAAAREIQRQTAASDMARRKAILNDMQSRGFGGSGMELAAQLDNIQKSQENQAAENDRLIREAQSRQLNALSQTGNLAGQVRQQSFGEDSAKAEAQDAIRRFNLQNQQRVADTNVGNKNQAQQYNLNQKQRIADTNVATRNNQQAQNKSLIQQQFNNRMKLAGARAGAIGGVGDAEAAKYQGRGRAIGDIAGGFTDLVGSMNDETDDEFLNKPVKV